MFAVCGSELRVTKIAEAMATSWNEMEIETDTHVCRFGAEGAKEVK
jgi:hypothetical protein